MKNYYLYILIIAIIVACCSCKKEEIVDPKSPTSTSSSTTEYETLTFYFNSSSLTKKSSGCISFDYSYDNNYPNISFCWDGFSYTKSIVIPKGTIIHLTVQGAASKTTNSTSIINVTDDQHTLLKDVSIGYGTYKWDLTVD